MLPKYLGCLLYFIFFHDKEQRNSVQNIYGISSAVYVYIRCAMLCVALTSPMTCMHAGGEGRCAGDQHGRAAGWGRQGRYFWQVGRKEAITPPYLSRVGQVEGKEGKGGRGSLS